MDKPPFLIRDLMDTEHRSMGNHACGDTTSKSVKHVLNRVGTIIFTRQDGRFIAVMKTCKGIPLFHPYDR